MEEVKRSNFRRGRHDDPHFRVWDYVFDPLEYTNIIWHFV